MTSFPLNSQQQQAVQTVKGPVLILAGAGTGKTRVIVERIRYMLSQGISRHSIVAVTFTNKAAREMRERLAGSLEPHPHDLFIGTFHSFCLNILRAHAAAARLPQRFGIASASDQIDVARRAIEDSNISSLLNPEGLVAQISKAKNSLLTFEDFAKGSTGGSYAFDVDKFANLYSLYEKHLAINRLIDFDDCIFKAVQLLREHQDIKLKIVSKVLYLLVDEFQDTNFSQLELIKELGESNRNVCVVGDDDQSIYSWRGAMQETFARFEAIFPERLFIKLEQNYRCTQIILDAANAVIKNNPNRKDKNLWSRHESQNSICIQSCDSSQEEVTFVTDKILSLLGQGSHANTIAILYRSNSLARPYELKLRELQIPYRTFGGQSFFERKEVKDFLSYLRLIFLPEDRLAFFRVINSPPRGLGIKTLEKVEQLAKSLNVSPYHIAKVASQNDFGKQGDVLKNFIRSLEELSQLSTQTPDDFETMGSIIIKNFGLADDIKQRTESTASRERKLETLRGLPKWLRACAEDMLKERNSINSLDLIDKLTLNDRDSSETDRSTNYVSLMTVHAAKGLEFEHVFVVGCEEDLFPHKTSLQEAHGLAEERRLFYVAMTRAKRQLYLSHCFERDTARHGNGFLDVKAPSRFLSEIPDATVKTNDTNESQQRVEVRKAAFLSALRDLKGELRNSAKNS